MDPAKPVFKDGVALQDFLGVDKKTDILGLFPLGDTAPTIAVGTSQGVVKRVNLSTIPERPHVEIISLKEGDRVVGVASAEDSSWLCFITDDAQLLRFPADQVRPQGPAAGGMAGVSLSQNCRVIAFASAEESDSVVTTSSSSQTLKGVGGQRVKVTPLSEFPAKGRSTKGVRAHSFLKGEDCLVIAAVATNARAISAGGKAIDLPSEPAKRDASGTVASATIGHIGEALRPAKD